MGLADKGLYHSNKDKYNTSVAGLPGNDDVSFFFVGPLEDVTLLLVHAVAHMVSGLFHSSLAPWVLSSSSRRLDFIHKQVRINVYYSSSSESLEQSRTRNPLTSLSSFSPFFPPS
jgi:hypothetical protein